VVSKKRNGTNNPAMRQNRGEKEIVKREEEGGTAKGGI